VIDPEGTDAEAGLQRSDNGEGFLARWSRRKQAGYRNHEHPSAAGPQSLSGEPLPAEDPQQVKAQRQLTDADMPPVDSLDEKSDFAAFMSPGVSEQLRVQALRKLFHLPGLHLPDGLDDYDDDFTQFAKLGDIVTHEMQRMLQRERQAADATQVASERAKVDVESETAPVKSDAEDEMSGRGQVAAGNGDQHNQQGAREPSSQDLTPGEQEGQKGTTG
jgi:hypothetical protein